MQNHISLSQGNKTYTDSLKDNEEGTKAKQQGDSTISLTPSFTGMCEHAHSACKLAVCL
jgi:hypothetical protein